MVMDPGTLKGCSDGTEEGGLILRLASGGVVWGRGFRQHRRDINIGGSGDDQRRREIKVLGASLR